MNLQMSRNPKQKFGKSGQEVIRRSANGTIAAILREVHVCYAIRTYFVLSAISLRHSDKLTVWFWLRTTSDQQRQRGVEGQGAVARGRRHAVISNFSMQNTPTPLPSLPHVCLVVPSLDVWTPCRAAYLCAFQYRISRVKPQVAVFHPKTRIYIS